MSWQPNAKAPLENVKGIPVFYGIKTDPEVHTKYQAWVDQVMIELEGVDVTVNGETKNLKEVYELYEFDSTQVHSRFKTALETRKCKSLIFKTMKCKCVLARGYYHDLIFPYFRKAQIQEKTQICAFEVCTFSGKNCTCALEKAQIPDFLRKNDSKLHMCSRKSTDSGFSPEK